MQAETLLFLATCRIRKFKMPVDSHERASVNSTVKKRGGVRSGGHRFKHPGQMARSVSKRLDDTTAIANRPRGVESKLHFHERTRRMKLDCDESAVKEKKKGIITSGINLDLKCLFRA